MSKDEKKERTRGKPKDSGVKPKSGINRFPGYLRNDLNLPDWVASSVIIVIGGLAMSLVVWLGAIFWPG